MVCYWNSGQSGQCQSHCYFFSVNYFSLDKPSLKLDFGPGQLTVAQKENINAFYLCYNRGKVYTNWIRSQLGQGQDNCFCPIKMEGLS